METSSPYKIPSKGSLSALTSKSEQILESLTRSVTCLTLWILPKLSATYKSNTFPVRTESIVLPILFNNASQRSLKSSCGTSRSCSTNGSNRNVLESLQHTCPSGLSTEFSKALCLRIKLLRSPPILCRLRAKLTDIMSSRLIEQGPWYILAIGWWLTT